MVESLSFCVAAKTEVLRSFMVEFGKIGYGCVFLRLKGTPNNKNRKMHSGMFLSTITNCPKRQYFICSIRCAL